MLLLIQSSVVLVANLCMGAFAKSVSHPLNAYAILEEVRVKRSKPHGTKYSCATNHAVEH